MSEDEAGTECDDWLNSIDDIFHRCCMMQNNTLKKAPRDWTPSALNAALDQIKKEARSQLPSLSKLPSQPDHVPTS